MEKIFKVSPGFRIFLWIFSIFCFLLVVLIPMGILLLYIALKAEVRMTHDTLERRWVGRKAVPWNEITELSWLPAMGYLQRYMRPLRIVAENPASKVKFGLPVGAFERTDELLVELQKRSGKTVA
ncbi:hypothetical protein F9K50_01195 [bacterium]|nr:MAG: hypothetical protein F9K50_01195 [bacterium]